MIDIARSPMGGGTDAFSRPAPPPQVADQKLEPGSLEEGLLLRRRGAAEGGVAMGEAAEALDDHLVAAAVIEAVIAHALRAAGGFVERDGTLLVGQASLCSNGR